MTPAAGAALSIVTTGLLTAAVWLLLFPVYDTNDDVGTRLVLEGRYAPGAEASGHAFLVNLALGQFVVWLYRLVPGLSWYDFVEQATLALTAAVALYLCIRSIRHWDQAAIVVLIASMIVAALAATQYTIIAALSTIVGATALIVALSSAPSRAERVVLSAAGALLLLLGPLFRLGAAVLGLLMVAISALYPVAVVLRRDGIRGKQPVIALSLLALVGLGAAWSYHFSAYLGSPGWKEFLQFNWLRAQLVEYAAARLPQDVVNQALPAAGWNAADYAMLKNWIFFDTSVFSTGNLEKIIAALPALPMPRPSAIVALLLSYASRFPFFLLGIAGVVLSTSNMRKAAAACLSLIAVIIIVVAMSVFLKPPDYRVFWPIAFGTIFVVWIALHLDQDGMPHWLQRTIAFSLLIAASLLVLSHVIERSRVTERARQSLLSDLAHAPVGPGKVLVILGAAFPYELTERPFARPYLQRVFHMVSFGITQRAPPNRQYLNRIALPDLPTWLCSDPVDIAASQPALTALASYYARYRNQSVSFVRVFKGRTFSVYHCEPTKPRPG
jgi:hypothetical protein